MAPVRDAEAVTSRCAEIVFVAAKAVLIVRAWYIIWVDCNSVREITTGEDTRDQTQENKYRQRTHLISFVIGAPRKNQQTGDHNRLIEKTHCRSPLKKTIP
jgi:hypothetical protein